MDQTYGKSGRGATWSLALTAAAVLLICGLATWANPPGSQPAAGRAAKPGEGLPLARAEDGLLPLDKILPGVIPPPLATVPPEQLPEQARELLSEGERLIGDKQYVSAITKLEQALGYAPRNSRVHKALGRANRLSGNTPKATLHLHSAPRRRTRTAKPPQSADVP